jgi:hypothetical protein
MIAAAISTDRDRISIKLRVGRDPQRPRNGRLTISLSRNRRQMRASASRLDRGRPAARCWLELARELLNRANDDESHLIPVVFNLSSWAVRRAPLAEWLVDELNQRYSVPRKVARRPAKFANSRCQAT